MRINDYPAQITDAGTGKIMIPDYEVDLICSYDLRDVSIDAIYRDGEDMDRSSDPLIKSLAAAIRTQAECDPWVIAHFEDWRDNATEAAYLAHQQALMESGGVDDSGYRRDMVAAGRGNLVGRS